MGNIDAFKALKALGGRATTKQVRKKLRELYPDEMYDVWCDVSLNRLANAGQVKHDGRNDTWTIINNVGTRNMVVLDNGKVHRLK